MIDSVHIQNFKCLRDVSVALGPFTVLIGPNDSGKSSLLDALQMLGRTTEEQTDAIFHDGQSLDNIVWQRETKRKIVWEIQRKSNGNSFSYSLELSPAKDAIINEKLFLNGKLILNFEIADRSKTVIPESSQESRPLLVVNQANLPMNCLSRDIRDLRICRDGACFGPDFPLPPTESVGAVKKCKL